MFYYLSKTAWFLATPSNLLPLLALAGALLMLFGRGKIAGFLLVVIGAGGMLAGLTPLPNWLTLPLEERFPAFVDDGRPVHGIIVLGGAVLADESAARGQIAANDAAERVLALVSLSRIYPQARIVVSGGGSTFLVDEAPEAEAIARFVEPLGVERARLILEPNSRTTAENAERTRGLINPLPGQRWLLVTSAWHMPRAVGSFRAVGFDVTPHPVDFRTRGPEDLGRGFLNASEGLRRMDLIVKEWVGLVAYRLTGRSDELFPGPRPPQPSPVSAGPIR